MRLPLPPCYPRVTPVPCPWYSRPCFPPGLCIRRLWRASSPHRHVPPHPYRWACVRASAAPRRSGHRPPHALAPGPPSRPTPGGSARAFQCRLAAPVRSVPSGPVRRGPRHQPGHSSRPGTHPHRTAQAGPDSRTGCPQGSVAAAGRRHSRIPPSAARAARFRIFRDGGEGHLSVPASGVCRPRPGQRVRSADTRATWEDTRWAG